MDSTRRIGSGIDGLDRAIDGLRSGDTVLWQVEHIRDYMFAATRFVTSTARGGQRIVYLRFGEHDEVIDAQALAERGANVKKYTLDPTVGFETFAVQVHRIIASEGAGVFYIFDCLTELQKYWFSDMMVCNFFCLTCPFLQEQQSIAYVPILYEKHIYETVSRIRHAAPVLLNIRTMNAATYIHAVKVDGRQTEYMYFPVKIDGANSSFVTSSAESYGIFDIFTQTGERRDCWDSMFDFVGESETEPTDAEGLAHRDNIIRCLLGNEPQRFALCQKYFTTADLIAIKKREIGTGCIGGKAVGMLLARRVLRATDPELYARRVEPHDSYFIGADVFYTYFVQNGAWSLRTKMVDVEDYLAVAPQIREKLLHGQFMPSIQEQFRSMLEYFGQSPIIVRSSSILEDGFGNAFAGKYDSVFCPNQGTPEERYAEFEAAVRTVYASTVNEDAIRYRADRDLLRTSRWRCSSCASAATSTAITISRTSRAWAIPRTCTSPAPPRRRRTGGRCALSWAWAPARSTARRTTMPSCWTWRGRWPRRRWPTATSINTPSTSSTRSISRPTALRRWRSAPSTRRS